MERERKRSQFVGVFWHQNPKKRGGWKPGYWKALIMVNGKTHRLGFFHDEVEAAKAYDGALLQLGGDPLKLNFPAAPAHTQEEE